MQIKRLYALFEQHPHVQTDTRALKAGEIFFALKGERFNGHRFAKQALDAGAVAVVIDEPVLEEGPTVFVVEDALKTLQDLARYHRAQFSIPFLAITGSNGKTTTKELVHAVLSSAYKTYTTKGNLNNHIGIPLTLLSIKKDAEMAIIEMGANHQKEIEGYCTYVLPTHGLITNCGKAHMEGFGGVEGIKKGKGELFDYLQFHGGTVFINSDLDYLEKMAMAIEHKIYFGSKKGEIGCSVLQQDPLLAIETSSTKWGKQRIFTRLVGAYNKPNVEAAICIGEHFGVPFRSIRSAIESYTPENARSQLLTKGSNQVILDAYNANPSSMKVALENVVRQSMPNKWLFLGGMMELGEDSVKEHQELVNSINRSGIEHVVLVGGDFKHTSHSHLFFEDVHAASIWLKDNLPNNALILIKGSRSTKMEKLLEVL
jgi:UDP-N-acetylmuramoyl-tripeptide--D-alanyl-D-alanine ligase